ncbi:MAG: MBL fold metallo-hydrolase [Armatimonadetes bacterium]|nr:MBL fold metallo-hydrolase [Armatimonadota bacterium]
MVTAEHYGPIEALHQGRTLLGFLPPYMQVRCYAVDGLLIDSGLSCFVAEVLEWAKERRVEQAVVTHHHEDHSGGAMGLQKAGVVVRASARTREWMRQGFSLRLYQKVVWSPAPRGELSPLPPILETARHRFQIIPAPGHCEDQIVLYEPAQGWLFSGDAFLARRVKYFRADEDFGAMLGSLETLCSLEFDALFCAHHPVLTGGRESLRGKLQYLRDLEGRVRELHQRGWSVGAIRRRLLGAEPWLLYLGTAGDVSKGNVIRSILHGPTARRDSPP